MARQDNANLVTSLRLSRDMTT